MVLMSTISFYVAVLCHNAECHCTECRYAECRYAECRYTHCRYAECRGAVDDATQSGLVRRLLESPLSF